MFRQQMRHMSITVLGTFGLFALLALLLFFNGGLTSYKKVAEEGIKTTKSALQSPISRVWMTCERIASCVQLSSNFPDKSADVYLFRGDKAGIEKGYVLKVDFNIFLIPNVSIMLSSGGCSGEKVACEMMQQSEWVEMYKKLVVVYNETITIK